ncbi:putative S-adenosylmethionine-dependent methyltransferase/MSMEI_2290 [Bremerella volcania]|uniref:Putative S-adenosylmethionine-dependent methyltransferase/MSMEI_2290 n=1 Tax=Bremerella volcania TaxID=2527984 RepID=A0A518C389_9BACT|nr:class I SAM-dependent methyltransferase [Bremerella volcania]QDU73683.1 putative S-adenosylmethionine-dependent methyltransferase/MSMEI_2290 [Bremerella volcania]
MSDFLVEEDGITDEEHQYLLMQMFFRGPMDKVREELRAVLDTIDVDQSVQSLPVWDIGCGRGELLEILNEAGFNAVGIDTSALMIRKLNELNLEARHGDAIDELRMAPDNSLCGITAFHVIEHMPFGTVTELLRLSYQKLAPGGFLLLETPNPFCFESLSFFYTDQTHVRPIQPYQLAFAVETTGFTDTRLHFTAPVPASRKQDTHNWMRLYQNHGIVAKKPLASASTLKKAA